MGPSLFSDGNRARRIVTTPSSTVLQWGRRYSATEILSAGSNHHRRSTASMGPSLFSDGNRALDPSLRALPRASMGPSLFSDGNCSLSNSVIQCGIASMGPSLFSDGNNQTIDRIAEIRPASMGPSLFSDGNPSSVRIQVGQRVSFNGAVAIQRRK